MHDRVSLASLYLTFFTNEWWAELTKTRKPKTFSWEGIINAFIVLFFPRATSVELANMFSSLYQVGMSVPDYYARFIKLARFAPHCEIPYEAARAHKIQRGLRVEYKPFMACHKRD